MFNNNQTIKCGFANIDFKSWMRQLFKKFSSLLNKLSI